MLIHIQCGKTVNIDSYGNGICSGCGKKVNIRVSNK